MAGRTHDVNIKFNANTQDLKKSEAELKKINKEIKQLEKGPLAGTDLKKINELKARYQMVQASIVSTRKEQEKLTQEINRTALATQKLTKEQKTQASLQKYIAQSTDRRNTIGMRTQRALGQSFLEAPLYSISFATMAGIASTVQRFIELDKVLTRIGIVTDRSAESMQLFARYANDAGKALGVTGKAFADASLTFLQQGGLAADYSKSLAESSIQLANITGARAEDTSEYITAIANSFKILETDGIRAGSRIADMLAALDAASGSSADEIASAFKRSASSFAAAGFSAEEAAAMIATVSETTRQSSEMVGTGFKTLIGNLAEVKYSAEDLGNITNQLQDVANQFGITFSIVDQSTGQMKDVPTILKEVTQLYNSTSNIAAKNALIEAVAGKEQRDRFIALVSNQDRYNELLKEAQTSSGAAERANAKYLDSIGAKVEQLSNEWEQLSLNIIESRAFKDLLDTTTALLANLNNMIESGNGFARVLALIAANLAPIMAMRLGTGALASAIGGRITGIGGIAGPSLSQRGRQSIGVGRTAGGFFGQALGGGAGAVLPSGLAERRTELLGQQTLSSAQRTELASINQQALRGQVGRAGLGVGVGLAASGGQILNVITQQNTTNMEKFVGSMSALAPAIGSAFGPIGTLVGSLVGLGLQFVAVDKNAAAFREELSRLNTTANESMASSRQQIDELLKVVTQSGVDKATQEYRDAANRLAQLLPALSVGQNAYGDAILDTNQAMMDYIGLKQQELELEKMIQDQKLQGMITAAQKVGPETSVGFMEKAKSYFTALGSQGEELVTPEKFLTPEEQKLDAIRKKQFDAQMTRMMKMAIGSTIEVAQAGKSSVISAQKAGFAYLVENDAVIKKKFQEILSITDEDKRILATDAFYKEFAARFGAKGASLLAGTGPSVDELTGLTGPSAGAGIVPAATKGMSASELYDIQRRILENTIDAHEQLIEKSMLQADIQKKIEESTDETYKTNLKQLQLKIQDAKLTKQGIEQYKMQIALLADLSARSQTQMVLTRSTTGGFRFTRQAGGEADKTRAINAAAEYESKTVTSYGDLVNQIYSLDQQISQVETEGGDASKLKSLRSNLIAQRDALKPEVEKAKTISALASKGNLGLAAQLTAGTVSVAQAQGALSAEEVKNIKDSAESATAGVISSQNLLAQSNSNLTQSNNALAQNVRELADLMKSRIGAEHIISLRTPGLGTIMGTPYNTSILPTGATPVGSSNSTINISNLNLPSVKSGADFMRDLAGMSNNASPWASSTKSTS